MSPDKPITLKISAEQIDRFCDELCRGSSNINRKHASLIALEGFVIRHAASDTHSEAFNRIISIIQGFSEQTRQELLESYRQQLLPALRRQQVEEIARIHKALSRNGFDQLLEQCLQQIPETNLQALQSWVERWCNKAQTSAQQASGYPDALNFAAAAISLQEYQAMCELKRRLGPI
ncbi:MAG: hypothetical protein OQL28_13015 [Sedimenticola sp.]|nr:hypothetical protein [Sedimenticola sp.]